jgi:multidrug efflux pump subunit AcrA (membrane-fusion protein)
MALGVKERRLGRWALVAGIPLLGLAIVGSLRMARASGPDVPTHEVKTGEFVDRVQMRGEVKALHSVALTAPFGAGDLQILKLARSGTLVKRGDLVVLFDATSLQRQLEQRRSELNQAEAEIERTRAQARIAEEQAITELEKARYDVERARLEASKQEILSAIEGEKTRLLLADAEQKLREIEQKLASIRIGAEADIASRKQRREKSLYDVRRVEDRIKSLTLLAPADGMVAILPNFGARFMGADAPEFKEGDRPWAGASIAELPDLSVVRVSGRVDEADRGRIRLQQDAEVRVDAVPDKQLSGRVVEISPLAKPDFSSWPVRKNFDLSVQLAQSDPRLRPGMSATARIAVERLPGRIVVPQDAVFNRQGRTVVYIQVRRGFRAAFEEREVQIGRRGQGQLIIESGLKAGERIALRDPTLEEAK